MIKIKSAMSRTPTLAVLTISAFAAVFVCEATAQTDSEMPNTAKMADDPTDAAAQAEAAQEISADDSQQQTISENDTIVLLELLSAGSLSCTFDTDAGTSDSGPSDSANAAGAGMVLVQFSNINVSEGSALHGDPRIAGELRLIPSNFGLHFYQFDSRGELSITTVAAEKNDQQKFKAILSRHVDEGMGLTGAQINGNCSTAPTDAL